MARTDSKHLRKAFNMYLKNWAQFTVDALCLTEEKLQCRWTILFLLSFTVLETWQSKCAVVVLRWRNSLMKINANGVCLRTFEGSAVEYLGLCTRLNRHMKAASVRRP
ncbi:hypothetical protein TRVL_03921 [Trypanosoma vivax]|nr:hypothetical protein TRVL_03921 [Trypanosoma vivax]